MISPQQLKTRLLSKGHLNDKALIINCTEVIELVGGYDNFIRLPIPTFFVILEAIQEKKKLEKKGLKK